MSQQQRTNSRGWVWLAWMLTICSAIGVCVGAFGAMKMGSAGSYGRERLLDSYGWAVVNLDSFFLMLVVSIIWIQVCSTAKDTEVYLQQIEEKLNTLIESESGAKEILNEQAPLAERIEEEFKSLRPEKPYY